MTDTTLPACSRCQGAGSFLQRSPLDPDEVDWDICPSCEGSGVSK